MNKTSRYQQLIDESKESVREVTVQELETTPLSPSSVLIDIREADEWNAGHAAGAIHLSRGVLEKEIEQKVPDPDAPILLYCAGGKRSVLAAQSLQRMGYTNVASLAGGFTDWQKARLPVVPGGCHSLKI